MLHNIERSKMAMKDVVWAQDAGAAQIVVVQVGAWGVLEHAVRVLCVRGGGSVVVTGLMSM